MKVGMTGTRHGMTDAQRGAFGVLLTFDVAATEFHHGSCQGADVEAAALVRHIRGAGCRIVCHPGPDDDPYRVDSGVDDETLLPLTHFARNRNIVAACELLLATPCEMTKQPRGGTWHTFGHARKAGKPVWVVWPDGTVSKHEGTVAT